MSRVWCQATFKHSITPKGQKKRTEMPTHVEYQDSSWIFKYQNTVEAVSVSATD